MLYFYIALQAIASFANAIMDKLQFHYDRSIFAKWAEGRGRWGIFWHDWAGPTSWKNKYVDGSAFVQLVAKTALAWIFDAWHFSQMVMFTSYQLALSMCIVNEGVRITQSTFVDVLIFTAILKAVHGVVFNPLFHKLLDRQPKKTNNEPKNFF